MQKIPYLFNILILLPIVFGTFSRAFAVDQGKFKESAGWRLLVGSLWASILILSGYGIFYPLIASPLLVVQVIYKSLWLGTYALPRLSKDKFHEIPTGIAVVFLLIVLIWPFFIPWNYLLSR